MTGSSWLTYIICKRRKKICYVLLESDIVLEMADRIDLHLELVMRITESS